MRLIRNILLALVLASAVLAGGCGGLFYGTGGDWDEQDLSRSAPPPPATAQVVMDAVPG